MKPEPEWVVVFGKGGEFVDVLDDNESCHPYAGGDYQGHCGGCDMCMLMQYNHWGCTLKPLEPEGYETVGDALGRMLALGRSLTPCPGVE